MTKKLFIQAFTKFFSGVVLLGLVIFLPAGTFSFPNGWLLMGLLFIPMFFAGLVMIIKNPELLKKRLKAKEEQREQRNVVAASALMFVSGFALAGFGFRFGWYVLPKSVSIGAAIVFLIFYLLYAEVLRENPYLSRTVEIQENQKVIDTGLYSIVRHPMYSVTMVLFLSMPLILGSPYSFLVFLEYPIIISVRIRNEEKFLEKELKDYQKYKEKVKYRLIPFIW